MNRKLALVFAVCILLGAVLASTANQPMPSFSDNGIGTRAAIPGLIVASNITQNTTWDLTFPFIYVTKNIWVLENVTLTILPEVIVRFELGTSLHVKGGIIADGSPFKIISFVPYAPNPATMDWAGISLENSTKPCVFDNVDIKYSEMGIACWGTDASITNSSIEFTFYFGILSGKNSRPIIRNNYINFTTWAGIICDNSSVPIVDSNRIKTSYYGIVCYDTAEVKNNTIETCWLGIIGWGDSNITFNTVRDCMDGIHGFYAAPRIENNVIISCDGNGTRFMHSNATLKNNRLIYNNVGMDIDYASRSILDNMVNNTVNGIEITDCFYVGQNDLIIDNLFIDSGWSKGYYGSLTAQGSVTLYDCRNVTIRDSTIINTQSSIYATNSSFTIYNSIFDNARKGQVFLDANASGVSFNRSVDPESVQIGGINCLFQTFDDLRVKVRDYYDEPIPDANVVVRESQLVLYNVTTGANGTTDNMVVKDRTVSDAGVIASPLIVQVYSEVYNFAPNPMTGVYVSENNILVFTDLGDIFPPEIVSLNVIDGDRAFPVNGSITVHFTEPMNKVSAENAFSITGNVTGNFIWDGFNMTFTPDSLDYSTYYTVTVSASAMDMWNNTLENPSTLSFTTAHAPGTGGSVILLVVIVIFAVAGIAGLLIIRKLKQSMK
jgi:hypothetical protein